MTIEIVDKKVLDALLNELATLTAKVELLSSHCEDKRLKRWLNGVDVQEILHISPRTLQTLRDQGRIGYTKIGNRIYYTPEDVEKVLSIIHLYRKPIFDNLKTK